MSDTTLNQFISRGTNAQRVAFTPNPATPATGNNPSYIWYETDTGNTYMWDGSAWQRVNTGATNIPVGLNWDPLEADPIIVPVPNQFSAGSAGLVPAAGNGTTNFLRQDGQWAAPAGSGSWSLISSVTASGTAVTFTGLGSYTELLLIGYAVTTAAGAFRFIQASTNNGTSYFGTSGDYVTINATGSTTNQGDMGGHSSSLTSATVMCRLTANLAGSVKLFQSVDKGIGYLANSSMITNAVNALQYGCTATMTGGTVTLYGK